MSWHLQQINGGVVTTVRNEYVACETAPAAAAGSSLFVGCTFGSQQHFTYIDDHGGLQDCWYDRNGNHWSLQQINGSNGVTVPKAPAAALPGLFVSTFGSQQHFTYIDASGDGNLQDCWYDSKGNHWSLQQINNATTNPAVPNEYVACQDAPASAGSSPFVCTFGSQQYFTYSDEHGHLQDCWYDSDGDQWNQQQINDGGPVTVPLEYVACQDAPASAGSSPFVCTFGSQQQLRPPGKLCISSGNGWTSGVADSLLHFAAARSPKEA
jgi:hypothetical protein